MDTSVQQKRRWLIEFGLASLIPMIVLGLVLSSTLKSTVRSHELTSARQNAQVVAYVPFGVCDGRAPSVETVAAQQKAVRVGPAGQEVACLAL